MSDATSPTNGVPVTPVSVRLLLLVEGINDIDFLNRISAILHADDPSLPDLAKLDQRGSVIFIPFGGGDVRLWSSRLVGLGVPQLHLYDREQPPETETRFAVAAKVNRQANCKAVVTGKRALENYLHTDAIHEACGITVSFSDNDPVDELVARQRFVESDVPLSWDQLTSRGRRRLRCRVKRDLNTSAVERMTVGRLKQSDPAGEIRQWLTTVADIVAD